MVGMPKQGTWTRREHTDPHKLTWAELWWAIPLRTKFLIQSVYDVLPSPANLHTCGLADTPECKLGQKRGTMEHILRKATKNILEDAEKALQWLWIRRGDPWCATWTQAGE